MTEPFINFRFRYRAMAFRVWAGAEQAATGLAYLEGRLGVLPFTGDGSNRRQNTLAVLELANWTKGFTVELRDDHEIVVSAELTSNGPATPAWALGEAIQRLAHAKHIVDMVETLQPSRHLRDARRQPVTAP